MDWTATLAGAAIVASLVSVWFTSRSDAARVRLEAALRRNERLEARREDVASQLDAAREPLIDAAEDLQQRLGNIQSNGFLAYLDDSNDHRRELALKGTLFRIGKYWAVVAGLRSGTDVWRFDTDRSTGTVSAALKAVETAFATDDYPEMMVWREEQRAIGELMLATDRRSSIGFAEFLRRYESDFATWFAGLSSDLLAPDAEDSIRLAVVHAEIIGLVDTLKELRPTLDDRS